jgi:hypothetical protein
LITDGSLIPKLQLTGALSRAKQTFAYLGLHFSPVTDSQTLYVLSPAMSRSVAIERLAFFSCCYHGD